MTPTAVVDVVLGLLPFIVGYATLRMSSRSSSIAAAASAKAVDAAAYERAKAIYEGAIDQLEGELRAVRTERDRLVSEVARLRDINDELEKQTGQLGGVRGELDRLRESNRVLLERLTQLGDPGTA